MQIGPWFILKYTLRVLAGLLAGVMTVWILGWRQHLEPRRLTALVWVVLLGALLGGRASYVAQHAAYFAQHPVEAGLLWRVGGLDGPGAWAGGLAAATLWSWRARFPLWQTWSLLAPLGLLLAAGEWWGCGDVGCAWGREVTTTVPLWQRWLVHETPDLYHTFAPRYAVPWLAAGVAALVGGLAALWPRHAIGAVALYLAGMAALTLLRADPAPLVGNLRLDTGAYALLALTCGLIAGHTYRNYGDHP
ncbi:MAG TPA: prolipoprotein diacylglyceryl transferase [Anaerolineae bacterium]|nr:prolipoprotein diacylglyceryl transferase [Anaerolineae bacterium]